MLRPNPDDSVTSSTGCHIGLIGGLAPRAGIFYYEQLQARHASVGAELDLTLRHADVARVLEYINTGDRLGLGEYLGSLSNQLFDAGADVVAVSAIAPHLAIREIKTVANGPVVNVLEAIPETLRAAGLDRVAIFGNRAVMDSNIYEAVDAANVVRLDPEVAASVHEMYTDIALTGKRNTPVEVEFLSAVADEAMANGAQALLLAGTDLSSFYSEAPPEFPYVDLAHVHIRQIMAR